MKYTKVHFIGIGGVSQSKLALMLKNLGYEVSGSDREESQNTHWLRNQGIEVFIGHKAENIKNCNLVVYNGAISDDNPELKEAKKRKIKLIKRSQMLSLVAKHYNQCIAVCGCHGKTTVTGLLAYAFSEKQPQMHIGGNLIGKSFEISNKKDFFITEACEFQKSFLKISPNVCVMLNIDADHLDCYKDIDDIQNTFKKFTQKIRKNGVLIYNNDDLRCKQIANEFLGNKISIGLNKNSDITAKNIRFNDDGIKFNLFYKQKFQGKIECKLFGRHNVYNLLATCAVCIFFNLKNYINNLKNFCGIERRMQFIGNIGNNVVIHDYAHHPAEITASLQAIKLHIKRPIIVVFEPHTYSRTKFLWNEFKNCFGLCEKLFLLPIYSAREKPIKNITSSNLSNEIINSEFINSKNKLLEKLSTYNNYIIAIMGAGSIEKLAHNLVDKN